jgi:hypothetical protein
VIAKVLPHLYPEELYRFSYPVAVGLSGPWDSYSADEQALLFRILGSVHVNPDSAGIADLSKGSFDSLRMWGPSRVLLFGCDWASDIPLYQVTARGSFNVIRADDLSAFDDQKKKMLWAALRQMFGV